jgi:dTMP kinase
LFITFEGADGCGKTTQMALLAQSLRAAGRAVTTTFEPGGTEVGVAIRKILLDRTVAAPAPMAELLLYFANRAQNVEEVIRPALHQGHIVLCDRFTDSTRAYQGAGRGLDLAVIDELDRIACRGLQPDITLVIDIPLEVSLERARVRNQGSGSRETRMDDQSAAFHQRVREAFHQMVRAEPERFIMIDGDAAVESVQARMQEALAGRV